MVLKCTAMKILHAQVLDPTHLELLEAVEAKPGAQVQITLLGPDEPDAAWRESAKRHLLLAYDEADSIYDEV